MVFPLIFYFFPASCELLKSFSGPKPLPPTFPLLSFQQQLAATDDGYNLIHFNKLLRFLYESSFFLLIMVLGGGDVWWRGEYRKKCLKVVGGGGKDFFTT